MLCCKTRMSLLEGRAIAEKILRKQKREMFDGLNAIPWADLTHAYGSAEEVPMWLRQLTSSDADIRHAAMNHLHGSICHQGWQEYVAALSKD